MCILSEPTISLLGPCSAEIVANVGYAQMHSTAILLVMREKNRKKLCWPTGNWLKSFMESYADIKQNEICRCKQDVDILSAYHILNLQSSMSSTLAYTSCI